MSYQGSSWFRHTFHFLEGVDPNLAAMFEEAMRQAGLPKVSEAAAMEHILADFLAGMAIHRRTFRERTEPIYRRLREERDE